MGGIRPGLMLGVCGHNLAYVSGLGLGARSPQSSSASVGLTSSCFFSLQLCGCGLLGVGIWLSVSQGNFATFSPSFPSLSAANLVIAIGTIVMVTGFLGCLGAIKENKCLLLSVSWAPCPQPSELQGSLNLGHRNGQGLEHQPTGAQPELRECASRMFCA